MINTILLVEDDEVDVMTVRRALTEIGSTRPLQVVGDGEAALEFLRGSHQPRPDIIILDLNLPRMNGLEFLREIKSDEALRRIPVVVLTTSPEEQDKHDCYELGVAGYVLKPIEYSAFVESIRTIDLYWNLSQQPR